MWAELIFLTSCTWPTSFFPNAQVNALLAKTMVTPDRKVKREDSRKHQYFLTIFKHK
jgi:hypothetical protein